jgi:hypothetical protein
MEQKKFISSTRDEETYAAKARWFGSLTIEERIMLFCDFTELALSANPTLAEKKVVNSLTGRVQILRKT